MPTQPDSDVIQPVNGALLASGFPFQTAVADRIRRLPDWRIRGEEVPWQDADGTDHFIDLIATRDKITILVECKKTVKEALTFLHPRHDGHLPETEQVRCIYTSQIKDSTQRLEVFPGVWDVAPQSAESKFCVVSTSASGRDQRMLERDARTLAKSTDAWARQQRDAFIPHHTEPDHLFIPLIVTNAPLFSACYNPDTVSLKVGSFSTLPSAQAVQWSRFRKSFSSDLHPDLGDRTIMVVNAESLASFLNKLGETIGPPKHERGPAVSWRRHR